MRWLQERLREQGYEVGAVDGKYGFLTEDAVMAFQRDRRLRVDGVAGAQVVAALRENPPRQRLVHVVEEGERLYEIAARYGVSPETLRWMNRLSPRARLFPGRRLVVWSTYVLAGLSPRASRVVLERSLALAASRASGFVDFGRAVGASGELSGPPPQGAWPAQAGRREAFVGLREGDGSELVAAAMRRSSRRRLAAEVKAALSSGRAAGVFVDPGPLPYGEGVRYLKTLAELRRAAPERKLAAAVPLPAAGWKGLASQFDYEAAGRLLDLAVLPFHRWEMLWPGGAEPLPWDRIEAAVARASRRLPPWRLLLGIPLGACARRGAALQEVPYRAAVVEGYAARRRFAPTSGGFLAMELSGEEGRPKEGRRRYLAQGRDAFARFLALAYRYRLAGVYLYPLSEEDSRLWPVLESRTKVMDASNITSSPGAYTSYNQSEGE